MQVKADPVYLVDRKGRVAYSITVKSAFDEVMELHSFPFDKQVFDIRVYFEPTDKHTWRVVNHPFESNAWYGKWSRNEARFEGLQANLHVYSVLLKLLF